MTSDDSRRREPAPQPDAPQPDAPQPDAAQREPVEPTSAAPDERTLAEVAAPASVRRAPRVGAFVRAGVLVGAVVGWVAAMLGTGTSGEVRTGALVISTVGAALAGALLGAALAALADRRSTRTRGRGPTRR